MSSPYLDMHCPFNWEELCNKFKERDWVAYLSDKLARKHSSEWSTYCYKLLLGCVYGKIKSEDKALEEFKSCEDFVDEKSHEMFFMAIVPGMKYMINASKCILYFNGGKCSLATEVASSMQQFKDLSNKSQASVWAVKAYILNEFEYVEKVKAFECVKLAIKLDPDEDGSRRGAWFYLAGKIKGQIRRTESGNEIPSSEELKYLERSINKSPFPVHYAVLAESYRESAKLLFRNHKNASVSKKLNKECWKLINKALNEPNLSCNVLMRCGSTLLKLPKVFSNAKLTEETLKRANKIEPNNGKVYLYLGDFEDWRNNNPKAALAYYEEAYLNGNEIVGAKMIKIRYRLDKSYNPLDDCDKYISEVHERLLLKQAQQRSIAYLTLKGEFHLRVRHDLLAAAREWEKAFEINPDSRAVLEYYPAFSSGFEIENLFEVFRKEIAKALESAELTRTETEYLHGLLKKYDGLLY